MTQLIPKFDYSQLDAETEALLRSKEVAMDEIIGRAYTDLGQQLKEAQDGLAKRGYGCFEEWYTSRGYKKDQVYRLIGRYELILANCDKRELIEDLPVSVTYEISKKSVDPEVKQKVLDGEIQSLKELREVKKALQEAEQRAAKAEATATAEQNSARHYEKLWEQAKNKPPIIQTQTVEVVPESLKKKLEKLEFDNNDLKHGYQNAKEKLQQYALRETDNYDAEKAQKELAKLQHEADINTVNVRIAYKQFIEKAAITRFLHGAISTASQGEKERLAELVEVAEQIIDQTKLALKGRKLGVVNE